MTSDTQFPNKTVDENKTNRLILFIGILFFRISLDISYVKIIHEEYYLYGFYLKTNYFYYVISYFSFILMVLFLLRIVDLKRPGSFLLLTLFLFGYIPNMSLFSNMDLPMSFYLMSNIYWFLTILFYYYFSHLKNHSLEKKAHVNGTTITKTNVYMFFVVMFILIVSYSITYYKGIRLSVDLRDSINARLDSRGKIGKIFSLLLPWASSIIFPLGMIIGIKCKNYLLLGLMCLGVIFAFTVNGVKTWLFVSVLSCFFAIFLKKEKQFCLLPFILVVINFFSFLFKQTALADFFNYYILRRIYFGTSLNNYYWIDFFSKNPKLYFTNSVLGWLRRFIKVPYSDNVSSVIGALYYNNEASNAASGTIAAAYSNLGWYGLVVYPLLVSLMAILLDHVCRKTDKRIPLIYCFPVIISGAEYLLNGSIATAFFTYGYLIGVILLAYLNKSNIFESGNKSLT